MENVVRDDAGLDEVRRLMASMEGWLSDLEAVFLYNQAREASGGVILEIGSYKGKSTICLAKGSRGGRRVPVYAIDPHKDTTTQQIWLGGRSSFDDFTSNMARAGVSDLVMPLVQKSEEAGRKWNTPIALLWIDGDHSYTGAKTDFELFSPWVIEGGVIAFHDATQGEVARIVCEAFSQRGFTGIGLVDSIAYASKRNGASMRAKDRFVLWCVANYAWARPLTNAPYLRKVKNAMKAKLSRL